MANIEGNLGPANLDHLMRLIGQPKSDFSADISLHKQVNFFTGLDYFSLWNIVCSARSKLQDAMGDNIVALQGKQDALKVEISSIDSKLQQDPRCEGEGNLLGLICQLILARWEFEAQAKKLRDEISTDWKFGEEVEV